MAVDFVAVVAAAAAAGVAGVGVDDDFAEKLNWLVARSPKPTRHSRMKL